MDGLPPRETVPSFASPLDAILHEFDLTSESLLFDLFPRLRLLGADAVCAFQANEPQEKLDSVAEAPQTFHSSAQPLAPFSSNISTTIASMMAEQTVRTLRKSVPPTILLSPMSQLNGAIQLAIIQLLILLCPLWYRAQLKQNELGASQHAARVGNAYFALFDLMYVITDGEAQWAGVGSDSSVDIGNWTFWKPFYPFGLYCPDLQMAQEPTLKLNDAAYPAALSPTPSLAKARIPFSAAPEPS
ncbi:hypothetical protein JCM10296v2_007617 [Rhodotorula toruloides]